MDHQKTAEALQILNDLGLPSAQKNERSALTLLAFLNVRPETEWARATAPLVGITPIMDWIRLHYGKEYKPNTRESFRRQTIHQFVLAGIAIHNPDDPARAVNSPRTVYQVSPNALALIKTYGQAGWTKRLSGYLGDVTTLTARYAGERDMERIPVQLADGTEIRLSPGGHSALIRDIIGEFAPRFAPGSVLIYAGDTGNKMGYFDRNRLEALGVTVDGHGKMPDVVIHDLKRNWLLLVESVTSHGPIDGKRRHELVSLFAGSSAGLVYVTAFPTRATMTRYLTDIAWESEVWIAEAPTHLIHFNGERFLGPYNR